MKTEEKLRRRHNIEKIAIKALVRQKGMSRNTTRRVLRLEEAGHLYQRKIQPMPALGTYIGLLDVSSGLAHNPKFSIDLPIRKSSAPK